MPTGPDYKRFCELAEDVDFVPVYRRVLSDALTPEQKFTKVANLLTKLRRKGRIVNTGPRAAPQWKLAE